MSAEHEAPETPPLKAWKARDTHSCRCPHCGKGNFFIDDAKTFQEYLTYKFPNPMRYVEAIRVGRWGALPESKDATDKAVRKLLEREGLDSGESKIYAMWCEFCGKAILSVKKLRNLEAIRHYEENIKKFYPSVAGPIPKFGYVGLTPAQFVEELRKETNMFLRQKVEKELARAGWIIGGLKVGGVASASPSNRMVRVVEGPREQPATPVTEASDEDATEP